MKGKLLSILMVVILLALAGCGDGVETARSNKHRVTTPDVNATDLATQVNGNSAFAFDLYQELKEGDSNLFYSPYSISIALAMTYAGARGETEQQMAETLHFILSQDSLHPSFNSLDIELASQEEGAKGKDGEGFRLNIVNAIWGQEGYKFLSEFLDVLAENYGAGLRLLNFAKAPEESRTTINDWVSDQTEDKIKDLIPEGIIEESTRLILTNAIYFYAEWLSQFDANNTRDATFHLADGDEVTVPMMSMSKPANLPHSSGAGYQAVELSYLGEEMVMTIIVPDSGNFTDFEFALNETQIKKILASLEQKSVDLRLPKFSYESSISLTDTLTEMGMQDAMSPGFADFSGIDSTLLLYISDIFHKAFVAVGEKGTESAAATAVIVKEVGVTIPDVRLIIDRPFIFLIRDIETGTILFVGRVMNPIA